MPFYKKFNNKKKIQESVENAFEKVEFFNHQNSVNRYLTALEMVEEGKEKKGWLWSEKERTFINTKKCLDRA